MSLLELQGLGKSYSGRDGGRVQALADVNLTVEAGEVVGVVGESGCGKSTLGRTLLRLIEPTTGTIRFDGEDITTLGRSALRAKRRDLQIIFQDPFGALNPRHSVRHLIEEPLIVHGVGDKSERRTRVAELLERVGLPANAAERYPHQFSGGQRQRIAIARALALNPRLIVADEPVSALDVSIQSQILNLIADLRRDFGLAILFISHDLSVIRHVSDRIAVMYLGRVVEIGPTEAVMAAPRHPYTQALLSAIPGLTSEGAPRERIVLTGELPDPAHPPTGCAFHGRCPKAMPVCSVTRPALGANGPVEVACHLYTEALG